MDYKYIEQLLERYWQCETTLEEEHILRTFFSQKEVPAALLPYQSLFVYEQEERQEEPLGDDFDQRILAQVSETAPVKARPLTLRRRLMPLFKAAAVVAIILTLGNAIQVAFNMEDNDPAINVAEELNKTVDGPSVAKSDSIRIDSMQAMQPIPVLVK